MKYFSFTSFLLIALLVITIQIQCMQFGRLERIMFIHNALSNDQEDNDQGSSSPENCTQEECKAGSTAFTLSATLGSIIAFPVCSALGASVGIAALATLGSGLTGTMIYMCCLCAKNDNSPDLDAIVIEN